jgi:hypothetical protein
MEPRDWPEINFLEQKICTAIKMDCGMGKPVQSDVPEVFNMLKSNL